MLLCVCIVHMHIIYVIHTYIKTVCFNGLFEKPTTPTGTDLMWCEGSLWVCTGGHTHRPYPVPVLHTPFAPLPSFSDHLYYQPHTPLRKVFFSLSHFKL